MVWVLKGFCGSSGMETAWIEVDCISLLKYFDIIVKALVFLICIDCYELCKLGFGKSAFDLTWLFFLCNFIF